MKRKIIRAVCLHTGHVLQVIGLGDLLVFSTADTATVQLIPLFLIISGSLLITFTGILLEKLLANYWHYYCRKSRRKRMNHKASKNQIRYVA